MNTHQQNITSSTENSNGLFPLETAKERYHAPGLTIHGKLERITLAPGDSDQGPVPTETIAEG